MNVNQHLDVSPIHTIVEAQALFRFEANEPTPYEQRVMTYWRYFETAAIALEVAAARVESLTLAERLLAAGRIPHKFSAEFNIVPSDDRKSSWDFLRKLGIFESVEGDSRTPTIAAFFNRLKNDPHASVEPFAGETARSGDLFVYRRQTNLPGVSLEGFLLDNGLGGRYSRWVVDDASQNGVGTGINIVTTPLAWAKSFEHQYPNLVKRSE